MTLASTPRRNHPGHDGGGALHADEIWAEMPEELAAMGGRVIQTPLSVFHSLFTIKKSAKRRLNDSTAHG
jgi:hypothetical protein